MFQLRLGWFNLKVIKSATYIRVHGIAIALKRGPPMFSRVYSTRILTPLYTLKVLPICRSRCISQTNSNRDTSQTPPVLFSSSIPFLESFTHWHTFLFPFSFSGSFTSGSSTSTYTTDCDCAFLEAIVSEVILSSNEHQLYDQFVGGKSLHRTSRISHDSSLFLS